MKKFLFLFFYFVVTIFLKAQNLVPNPSFEQYSSCPTSDGQIELAFPWFNPTQGTPDYYNICYANGAWDMGVPANWIGYQNAKTGIGYAGIAVYPVQNPPSYREYIAVKLMDSLIAGTKYYISFSISLADSVIYATDDIGAYLSSDSIFSNSDINLLNIPQIENLTGNIITDKQNWKQVSGNFVAQGGEKFITIGNFKNDSQTDTVFVSGGDPNYFLSAIYYYIDDICVSSNPDTCNIQTSINSIDEQPISIDVYPNPAKDKIFIKAMSNEIISIQIYNAFGEKVLQNTMQSYNVIDLSNYSIGIYYIRVQIGQQFIMKKIILSK